MKVKICLKTSKYVLLSRFSGKNSKVVKNKQQILKKLKIKNIAHTKVAYSYKEHFACVRFLILGLKKVLFIFYRQNLKKWDKCPLLYVTILFYFSYNKGFLYIFYDLCTTNFK